MNKNKLTVSKLIKHLYPKIGCTPPKIFTQRTRLIKLIAEASIALNNFMYYDQEEWGEHNCESVMAKIQDEWEKRDKSAVPSVKSAKSEAALQEKGRTK